MFGAVGAARPMTAKVDNMDTIKQSVLPNQQRLVRSAACLAAILLLPAASARAQSAADILRETGVKGGLIVHLGCGDGKLTADLGAGVNCLVQGLDTREDTVTDAREFIRGKGLYGRVSVERWDDRFCRMRTIS